MKKISILIFIIFYGICFGKEGQAKADSIDYYLKKDNPIKALNYIRKKANKDLAAQNYRSYCDIMYQKALLFEKLNDTENALVTLFDARKIAEKNKFQDELVLIYTKIGNLYTTSFEFSKAKKYLHTSNSIALKTQDKSLLSKSNQALFRYHTLIESDSAEYYLKKVELYTKNSDDLFEKIKNSNNFFSYYFGKKDYVLAKQHIDTSLAIAQKMNDKDRLAEVFHNLGTYYIVANKNYEKGKEQYLKVLHLYPNNENSSAISQAYLSISYAYEKLGDYKNALLFSNKYLDLNDEIFKGRLTKNTQDLETKYTVKKIEDSYKEREKVNNEKQSRNQKILILFIILIVLGSIIFYFYYQNLLLKQKNKLKDIDSALQYKIISATLDGQDQERNKISGILHDNVSAILSSVGLHLSAFESSLSKEQIEDLKKTRSLLKQAHDKVRDLSHELVSPLLVKFGLQFALNDLCENNSNSLLKFEFHSSIPNSKKFNLEFETKIFHIVSELFNNIIKHSQADLATLTLSLIDKEQKLMLVITDNGKGIEMKNGAIPSGFGLTQIKARLKNLNGTMAVKSEENAGTTITIAIELEDSFFS